MGTLHWGGVGGGLPNLDHIFLQCLERPAKTKCIKKRSAQNCINYKIKSLIEKKKRLKEKRFIEKRRIV